MERDDRRDMYQGFGNTMAVAFELALIPALTAGLGYLLDRWLGIVPVLTIVLLVVGLFGVFVKLWYRYDASMKELEARGPWARKHAA